MAVETGHNAPTAVAHASTRTYVIIFVVLFVVTSIEVATLYLNLHPLASAGLLSILSVLKFALVAMFFMHLYFDGRLLVFIFLAGLLMAITTAIGVKLTFYAPSLALQAPRQTRAALGPPDPKKGPAVFVKATCATCHTVQAVPQARAKIGPELDGIATRAAARMPGKTADLYIRESIEQPGAYVVPGFANVMPPTLRGMMDDREYQDLVAWLETLK